MALLTEDVRLEAVEVLEDGTLNARETTVILRDGVEVARTSRVFSLFPGDDLTGHADRLKVLAAAVWTQGLVESRRAAKGPLVGSGKKP